MGRIGFSSISSSSGVDEDAILDQVRATLSTPYVRVRRAQSSNWGICEESCLFLGELTQSRMTSFGFVQIRRRDDQDNLVAMSAPEDSGAAKYHLKFDEYIPLESEQVMRSYSTTLTGSKPPSTAPSTSKPIQPAMPLQPSLATPASRQSSPTHRAPPTPTSPTRGRFVRLKPSEPATPDFAYGIIHLYRDITGTEDAEITSVGKRVGTPEEENVLAILAVPSYMTANDFMGFVGDKQRSQVSHFRMIRTEAANRYMVLLKFRTNEAARGFHSIFNGKGFNSMEVDPLHPSDGSRKHVMSSLSRALLFNLRIRRNWIRFSHLSMIRFFRQRRWRLMILLVLLHRLPLPSANCQHVQSV
jgi:BRCA1-associated protein 2